MFVSLCVDPCRGLVWSAGVSSRVLLISNDPSHSIQVSLWDVAFSVVISLHPCTPSLVPMCHLGKFCTMFYLGAVVNYWLFRSASLKEKKKKGVISFFCMELCSRFSVAEDKASGVVRV